MITTKTTRRASVSFLEVDLSKVDKWKMEDSRDHTEPVPVVTQAERDLYSRLSHKPSPQPQEIWVRRELHKKIQYRDSRRVVT